MEEPTEQQQQIPLHVQQAQQIAARLQQVKAGSDSVTWVPELIPQFVQRAVEAVLIPTQGTHADSGSTRRSRRQSNMPSFAPFEQMLVVGMLTLMIMSRLLTAAPVQAAAPRQHQRLCWPWRRSTCVSQAAAAAARGLLTGS